MAPTTPDWDPTATGLIAATVISVALFYVADYYLLGSNLNIFIASLVGLGVMACLFVITEYYTGTGHRPVNEVAKEMGVPTMSAENSTMPRMLVGALSRSNTTAL